MRKKIIPIILFALLFTGCFDKNEKNIVDTLKKSIEKNNAYHITGNLEILNNDDSYVYDVDVAYEKDDKFRVSLKNKTNNHEQIILKNEEGVFVLTPSLNKSFKFQSDWPYNNSQVYLLQTLLNDIENDSKKEIKTSDDGFVITTKVDYSNKKNLTKQKIYLNKKGIISKVEVLNEKDIVKMKMNFNKIDMDATFNDNHFDIDKNMNSEIKTEQTMKTIEDIIYPMYMPTNTYLQSQDTLSLENGERIILTFAGENSFMLIEETLDIKDEYEMTNVYGEPEILIDTIGSVTENSASWISNGVEYYAVSEVMSQEQLLEVVNSISAIPVGK
ncbi:MAG: hypothetical protein PHN42_01070 [Bacilli bacterium]|nr:hypothetical protein [Bacilli bacterium]